MYYTTQFAYSFAALFCFLFTLLYTNVLELRDISHGSVCGRELSALTFSIKVVSAGFL